MEMNSSDFETTKDTSHMMGGYDMPSFQDRMNKRLKFIRSLNNDDENENNSFSNINPNLKIQENSNSIS